MLSIVSLAGLLSADSAQAADTCVLDRVEIPSWYCVETGPCGFGCQEVCVVRYDNYGRDREAICQDTTFPLLS